MRPRGAREKPAQALNATRLLACATTLVLLAARPVTASDWTLTVHTPEAWEWTYESESAPPRGPGQDPPEVLRLGWIQRVHATCTRASRPDEPQKIVASITTPNDPNVAQINLLWQPRSAYPRLPRDARGRQPPSVFGYDTLDTHLVMEHLAGEFVHLTIGCGEETWRQLGRVSRDGPPGWELPSDRGGGGCVVGESSDIPIILLGLLGLLLLRARRPRRLGQFSGALLAAAWLLGACDSDAGSSSKLSSRLLYPGVGEPNTLPLWPIGEGIRHTTRATFGNGFDPDGPRRDTPDPARLEVDLSSRSVPGGTLHRFARSLVGHNEWQGTALLETHDGDLYLVEGHQGPIEPPMLLVPAEIRLGMSWEVRRPLERDMLIWWAGNMRDPADMKPVHYDPSDVWVFTVTRRQPVPSPYGERVLWRIEWAGPPAPAYSRDMGRTGGFSRDDLPAADELFRIRGAIDILEGHGPILSQPWVHALDVSRNYNDNTIGGRSEPSLAWPTSDPRFGFPAPPDLAAVGVAGAAPQAGPELSLKPLGAIPELTPMMVGELRGLSSSAGLGLASVYADTHRDYPELGLDNLDGVEIFIEGVTTDMSIGIDPSGGSHGYFTLAPALMPRVLEGDTLTPLSVAERVGDFFGDGHLRHYFHPDGTRHHYQNWLRINATVSTHGDPFVPTPAHHVVATWWRGERILSLAVTSPGDQRLIVDWDALRTPTGRDGSQLGRPLFALPEEEPLPFHRDRLSLAMPRGDGVVLGTFLRRARLIGSPPGVDARVPRAFFAWMSDEGTVRERVSMPAWRVSQHHADGAYRLASVGELGELRALNLSDAGVWPELRGRLALPAGHIAVGALQLSETRFFVLTQQSPALRFVPELQYWRNLTGVRQAWPKVGALHAFEVEAPPTGLLDERLVLRLIDVTVGDSAIAVCLPPDVPWTMSRFRLGDRELDPAEVTPFDGRCALLAWRDADIQPSRDFGWTPLSFVVDGLGWVFRALPVLEERTPALRPNPIGATLADGSRVTASDWEAPFRARTLAGSASIEGVSPPRQSAAGTVGSNAMSPIPDLEGHGLWLAGPLCGTYWGGAPYDWCWTGRPDDVPDGWGPCVLADRRGRQTFWCPPGDAHALPGGGLAVGGMRLDPDGTLSPLPGDGTATNGLSLVHQVFADGTACGVEIDEPQSLVCISADGVRRVVGPTLEWGHLLHAQGPALLVGLGERGGRLFVDVLDAGSALVQSTELGPTPSGWTWEWPERAADGSLWWTLGAPLSRIVSVSDGAVRTYPLEQPEARLWSVGLERLYWQDGTSTPRPDGVDVSDPTAGCVPSPEQCNGRDDDCDGTVDNAPPDGPPLCDDAHGQVACVAGRCVVAACDAGWDDCNLLAHDGCETPLGTTTDCLTCRDRCRGGAACEPGGCGLPAPPSLVAGYGHFCALDAAARVTCSGDREAWGPPVNMGAPLRYGPAQIGPFPGPVVELAAAARHTCARLSDGRVTCWGAGGAAIGPAATDPAGGPTVPTLVTGLAGATRIFAGPGLSHEDPGASCALIGDDAGATSQLWCWGEAIAALTGATTFAEASQPTRVPGGDGAIDLALVAGGSCALFPDATVSCFGFAQYHGSPEGFGSALAPLADLPPATGIWADATTHASSAVIVLETTGGFYALGCGNRYPALGVDRRAPCSTSPQRIAEADGAPDLFVNYGLLCLLDPDAARCTGAGANHSYQLGVGTTASHRDIFAEHAHPFGFHSGAASLGAMCLVAGDATLWCAGSGPHLGQGTAPVRELRELELLPY